MEFKNFILISTLLFASNELNNLVNCQESSQIQYIKFYRDNACKNLTGEINDTSTILSNTTELRDAQSIRVNGMWQVHEPKANPDGSISTWLTLRTAQETCFPKEDPERTYSIAERFGNAYQNATEISFYTETGFDGIRFKNEEGKTNMTLPRVIAMQSWFFTGMNQWTVYPNIDFTGGATCLSPGENVTTMGYGFTRNWTTTIVVGSVKLGCDGFGTGGGNVLISPTWVVAIALVIMGARAF